jgi:pimeloyl-ACP methyl ester carboxylesterase
MKWSWVFLFLLFVWGGPLHGQPQGAMNGGPMFNPQEQQKIKDDIKANKTDAANFEKRAEFARMWIMLLVTQGNAGELQRFAPPGTIPRIKQSAGSSPQNAYQELDGLFRELEKMDQSSLSTHAAPMMPPPGMQGQPSPSLRQAHGPPAMETGVTSIEMSFANPASGAQLWAKVYYPSTAGAHSKLPAVIYIPGALGYGSDPLVDRAAEIIAADGFAVAVFDPDGRGKSGGAEDWNGRIQQDGLRELIRRVAGLEIVDRNNIGIVSLSYGIALAAGVLGRYPDDGIVGYLIDVEGPSDRFAITLHDSPIVLPVFHNHRTTDARWWQEREAVLSISHIKAKYLRVQNERDHTQPQNRHAIDMIDAATNKAYGGTGQSPWTRVNGPENQPNKTYSTSNPPKYRQGKGMVTPGELLPYIREMAGEKSGSQ